MKVKRSLCALMMLLALTLSACTGQSSAPSASPSAPPSAAPQPSASPQAAEATEPAAPADGEYVNGIFKYYDTVTINAMARYNARYVNDPQTLWLYKWAKENMNIEFVIEGVAYEATKDRTNLMFAANDLPEVLFNWPDLSSLRLHTIYGDDESQLIVLNDYITNPDLMPNLSKSILEVPEVFERCKTLAGNAYCFPWFSQLAEYTINLTGEPIWYNPAVFAAVGYEDQPATLDEFLDALQKIKADDPMGAGENNVPLGGGGGEDLSAHMAGGAILNAYGFLTGGTRWNYMVPKGGDYRSGELVFLRADPLYYEYLKYIKTLYDEGLIERDYYTLDATQISAKLSSGYYACIAAYDCYNMPPDSWQEWRIMEPLTSEFNDIKMAPFGGAPGGANYYAFITNVCKNPEAVARFMDPGYSKEYGHLYFNGPQKDVEETYGMCSGWYYAEDGITMIPEDVEKGLRENNNAYNHNISPFAATGNKFDRRTDGSEVALYTMDTMFGLRCLEDIKKVDPYLMHSYPGALFDSETANMLSDLENLMEDYIETESAKFITGARELNDAEWNKYLEELRTLGLNDYISTQLEAYNAQFK